MNVECTCGEMLVSGEAEIEVIPGLKMLVPALICPNTSDNCNLGFLVSDDVYKRAQELAKAGYNKYFGRCVS